MTTPDARSLILPRVLLIEDVATALGVSVRTARDWLRTGRIPGRRIGRRWLVSREQLLAAIESASAAEIEPDPAPARPTLGVLPGGARP